MEEIKVRLKGKIKNIMVKRCGFLDRSFGLMFRTKNHPVLLFDFKKRTRLALTSYFVFFPFLVLWLDESNHVLERKIVRPFVFSIKPDFDFTKIIEIPLNENNKDLINSFVDGRKV